MMNLMEYEFYRVERDTKLKDLAIQLDLTENMIMILNPKMRTFKAFLSSTIYVPYNELIKIPIRNKNIKKTLILEKNDSSLSSEENFRQNILYDNKKRYRCEQNNIILVDSVAKFNSEIKTQYLLSHTFQNQFHIMKLILEDYINTIQPNEMEVAFDLIKKIEFIRNQVNISYDIANNTFQINNMDELKKQWQIFSQSEVSKNSFFMELENKNPEVFLEFIKQGNHEYSNQYKLLDILDKNLFYHILFKSIIMRDKKDFVFKQKSQIFPNIENIVNIVKSKVSENEETTTYRLVGDIDPNKINKNIIQKYYSEVYQPLIKYSFTEYDYIYRITYEIENKTGLIKNATASVKEQIKNNYEIITHFTLREIEL